MAFANAHEVFHCDINPSNILVPALSRGDTSVTTDPPVTGDTSVPGAAATGSLLVDWACSRQQASLHSKVRVSEVSLVTLALHRACVSGISCDPSTPRCVYPRCLS